MGRQTESNLSAPLGVGCRYRRRRNFLAKRDTNNADTPVQSDEQ